MIGLVSFSEKGEARGDPPPADRRQPQASLTIGLLPAAKAAFISKDGSARGLE